MTELGAMIAHRARERAAKRGRDEAERAFLAFHGEWTEDHVQKAVAALSDRLMAAQEGNAVAAALRNVQVMARDGFERRLRELIAAGQPPGGNS